MSTRSVTLCTLYEGDYHYGVGALANSLHAAGYAGDLWVGTRGERPPWADGDVHRLPNGLTLRFADCVTPYHFSHYKPWFMRQVGAEAGADVVAYFDPDIVVKAPWSFFVDWFGCGIAVVEDFYCEMSAYHPFRKVWAEDLAQLGEAVVQRPNRYFNAGFLGIRQEDASVLNVWAALLELLPSKRLPVDKLLSAHRLSPYRMTDQDFLNAALMSFNGPISRLPRSAMDFVEEGYVMTHFTPGRKPWQKGYLRGPHRFYRRAAAQRVYERFQAAPIQLYSHSELRWRWVDARAAAVFGRFYAKRVWE